MNYFKTGQFFGQSNQTISLDGVTVTETVYDYEFIDWHYHENPHFSFVLFGNTCEGNSRETYECSADTLLFHNWQEPHYNVKPAGLTRVFRCRKGTAFPHIRAAKPRRKAKFGSLENSGGKIFAADGQIILSQN